jgi:RNA polymerase sigma-70 factor (ECF subfamily)
MDTNVSETAIREACDAQDQTRATTLALELYGPEVLGFLHARLRHEDAADEVFALFSHALWQALPGFEWRCTLRTFAYKIARNVASRYRREERRHVVQVASSQWSSVMEQVRTRTRAYLRTEVKDDFRALREQLSEEDQTLLILRVDRRLQWLELAEVMLGQETSFEPEQLKTEAARLRKRFQLIKASLREAAQQAGLLSR